MVRTEIEDQYELLKIATLIRMGFDISRLEFLRWLVDHRRDPEWVDVTAARGLKTAS